jgi:ABC-type sugar transport system ATPase subunit
LFLISELKKKRKGKVNSSTIQEIDRLSDRILVLEKELVDKTVALQQFEVQLYLQILYW